MVIGDLQKKRPTDRGAIFFASEVESSAIELDRLNPKLHHKNLLFTHFCPESDAFDQSFVSMGT